MEVDRAIQNLKIDRFAVFAIDANRDSRLTVAELNDAFAHDAVRFSDLGGMTLGTACPAFGPIPSADTIKLCGFDHPDFEKPIYPLKSSGH